MGIGGLTTILKSVDPVGKQLFQPKAEGGAGLPDFLGLYGYGPGYQSAQGQTAPVAAASPAPPIPATLVQPTPIATSSDQRLAQRKSLADQLARKGRSSTILTNQDSLGATG